MESDDREGSRCAIFAGDDGLEDWDRYFDDVRAHSLLLADVEALPPPSW
jgi:hypothetical protein